MGLVFDNHMFLVFAPLDIDYDAYETELDQYQVTDAQLAQIVVVRTIAEVNAAIVATPLGMAWCCFLSGGDDTGRKLLMTYWGVQSTFAQALNAQHIDVAISPRRLDRI